MRLFLLLLIVCSTNAWDRVSRSIRKKQGDVYHMQIKNKTNLELWGQSIGLENNTCFIHVPRTGGLSFRSAARKLNIRLEVWHSNRKAPPMECGCMTNLRHPVKRYISEWKYYGMNFFDRKKKLFGWIPKNGFPHSFEDYFNDTSTHNAFTKILSGCQMFTDCSVTEEDVDAIVKRVTDNCLKVLFTETTPVHNHHAVYIGEDDAWYERAEQANRLDMQLYRRLTHSLV